MAPLPELYESKRAIFLRFVDENVLASINREIPTLFNSVVDDHKHYTRALLKGADGRETEDMND